MAGPYYPSAQVRIQMRIDEGANTDALRNALDRLPGAGTFGVTIPSTEAGIQASLDTTGAAMRSLARSKSILSPHDYQRQLAQLESDMRTLQFAKASAQPITTETPDGLKARDSDQLNVIFTMLPKSVSIERNSTRDPHTFSATFDYRELPIDPRSIRAAFVSVTIGSVSSDAYQRGIVHGETYPDGMAVSVVEHRSGEELTFSGTQTRFVGFVDEWEVNFSDDGDEVTISGRDVTALLLDQRLPSGMGVDLNLPLDRGIQQLVNSFPSSKNLKVFFGTPEQLQYQNVVQGSLRQAPIPRDSLPETALSRGGKKAKAQRQGDQDDTVWDHITTVAAKLGYIPVMRNFVLFLVEPRNVFRQVAGARKMVYGRNVSELSFSRKLGGVTTQTIEVRSPNPMTGRTLWARFPVMENEPKSGVLGLQGSPQPVVSRAQKVSPSGQPEEQVMVYTVPRVTDQRVLERIAENTFEQMARQEIEGSFTTSDLDSFHEDSDDSTPPGTDLLDLYPGDPITILVAPPMTSAQGDPSMQLEKPDTTTSSAQELSAMTFGRRFDYLSGLGMKEETARRLALAAENVPLANTFRVGAVNIKFDAEDGIEIDGSFYNFITVRELGEPDGATTPEFSPPTSITQAAVNL